MGILKEMDNDGPFRTYSVSGMVAEQMANDSHFGFGVYLMNITESKTLSVSPKNERIEMGNVHWTIYRERCSENVTKHSELMTYCPFTVHFDDDLSGNKEIENAVDGEYLMAVSRFEVDGGSPFDSNYFAVNNMKRNWTDRNFHFLLYSGDDVVVEMEDAVNGTVRVESYQFYTLNLSMGHLTG